MCDGEKNKVFSSRSQHSHLFSNVFTRHKDNIIESIHTTRSNYRQENSAAWCETSFSLRAKIEEDVHVRDACNKFTKTRKTSEKRTKKTPEKFLHHHLIICSKKNQFFLAKKKSFSCKEENKRRNCFIIHTHHHHHVEQHTHTHTQRQQQRERLYNRILKWRRHTARPGTPLEGTKNKAAREFLRRRKCGRN